MSGLASRILAPVIQTFDSVQPVPVQIVLFDVNVGK